MKTDKEIIEKQKKEIVELTRQNKALREKFKKLSGKMLIVQEKYKKLSDGIMKIHSFFFPSKYKG